MRPVKGSAIVFQTNAEVVPRIRERPLKFLARLGVGHFQRTVRGRRHVADNRIEEGLDADVERRRGAQQRKQFARSSGGPEPGDQLLLRQRAGLEELLHQSLVGFGDHLDERFARARGIRRHVSGDIRLGELAASIRQKYAGLLRDEIDDAAERLFFADRQLNRNDRAAQRGVNRLERALQARALAVEAIDDHQAGQSGLLGGLPCLLRLHLNAGDGVNDENGRVSNAQSRARIGQKVGDARRVDEVDLCLVPFGVCKARRQGVLSGDFLVVVVGDGGAFVDFPEPVDRAGVEEGGRGELGLPGRAVADQGDIPDVCRVIDLHGR